MKFPEEFVQSSPSNLWISAHEDISIEYSDGSEAEQYLETCVKQAADRSSHSSELAEKIRDWPSEYHLSAKRSTLFRPLQLDRYQSVLELGAGCGALTRFLGETLSKVVAVEGSRQRAQVAAWRCEDLPNVQVVHGNFQDLEFEETFDVVTLIGVLEYSPKYLNAADPFQEALRLAKSRLKPDGLLIVAIENQLGLKYFAGCHEEHTDILFDGLEGYTSGRPMRTFGRNALANLLQSAGFSSLKFLYPLPDYKLPDCIVDFDAETPAIQSPFWYQWMGPANARDYNHERIFTCQEFLVAKEIESNGFLPQMSNSFLVLASPSPKTITPYLRTKTLAWKYNANRAKPFMTKLTLEQRSNGSMIIRRQHVYPELKAQREQVGNIFHHPPKSESFCEGDLLVERLFRAVKSQEVGLKNALHPPMALWYSFLREAARKECNSETEVTGKYWDCVPWNLIVQAEDRLVYIDQEWSYHERLPIKYVLFRGFFHIAREILPWLYENWAANFWENPFLQFFQTALQMLGLSVTPEEVAEYKNLEWRFLQKTLLASNLTIDQLEVQLLVTGNFNMFRPLTEMAQVAKKQILSRQKKLHQQSQELHKLQIRCEQLVMHQQQLDFTIQSMQTSKFWKLRTEWFKVKRWLKLLVYPFTTIRKVKKRIINNTPTFLGKWSKQAPILKNPWGAALPMSDSTDYSRWLAQHYFWPWHKKKLNAKAQNLDPQTMISIILPVLAPPTPQLRESVRSVFEQVYTRWELCLVVPAEFESSIKSTVGSKDQKDSRVRWLPGGTSKDMATLHNQGLNQAQGEFVGFLHSGDLLAQEALYEVAHLLAEHNEADMVYSDEDHIDAHHCLKHPYFKPDWCPESFLSRMYTGNLGVYRKSLLLAVGGFREGWKEAGMYDLLLRLTEKTQRIFHIPKVLYHARLSETESPQTYTHSDAQNALQEALKRRGEDGHVETNTHGYCIVRYDIPEHDLVSVIIPTRNYGKVLNTCLESLFQKTDYPNYEVLVMDNGSTEPETLELFETWQNKEPERFRCAPLDIPFNFSKINNQGVLKTNGKYLLFLNNDTEILTPDWMSAMVEQAQRPPVGVVGALLLYPDDQSIQHAGVIGGLGGVADHSHKLFPSDVPGYFGQIQTINNYSAVTAACVMCRREVFDEVGGFEEELAQSFNDVDLCFKIVEKGYRNVYLPHVVLNHYESKSRGYEDNPVKQARFAQEIRYMQHKWPRFMTHDPCYNINLSIEREGYKIRS